MDAKQVLNKLRKHLGEYSHGNFPTTAPLSFQDGGEVVISAADRMNSLVQNQKFKESFAERTKNVNESFKKMLPEEVKKIAGQKAVKAFNEKFKPGPLYLPKTLESNRRGGMLLYKKGGTLKSRIECHNPKCNHDWDRKDGGDDMYICHECGTDNTKFYGKGGSIHIDKNKRGTFTAAATKHNKSVQGFAKQVLANKENYSPAMVKKANFARNASKWKH